MPKGAQLQQPVLDALLGAGGSVSHPTTLYVALFTNIPDANGGTEVGGPGGYQRVAVTNNGTNWVFTSPSTMKNGSTISFPTVLTPGWGTIYGFGLYDIPTLGSGFLYYAGSLSAPLTPNVNDVVIFAPSALVITED
jgi:hypothetical protein